MQSHSTVCQSTVIRRGCTNILESFGTKNAIMAGVGEDLDLSVEEQLAQLRQQVVEDRASREAAEKAAADREASSAGRAAKQQRQHDEMMQMLVRRTSKQSGTEEQKNQDEQVREAPATSGEVEDPAPSTSAQVLPRIAESVVPVEVGPREGQPSESGQDRDYGLHGESAKTHESRRFVTQTMKIVPPTLKDRKGFQSFQTKVDVFSKYHGFDGVLKSEEYLDVGGSMSKEDFLRKNVSAETYEKHLKAWVFLSQAFELPTDLGRFRRSTSPGKFWQETVEWYCPKTTGNKTQLRKDFNNFHVQKGRNPIPALFGLEDHVELMRDAGIIVDSQSVYGTFVAGLPPSEYEFEIRELSRKQVFDREEIINVIQAQYDLLQEEEEPPSSPCARR